MSVVKPDMKYLFNPRSVAVVGASAQEGKIGYSIIKNIIESGFKGSIYPVNPKGGEVLGIPIHHDISDIKGEIDLVTIVIPAKFVFDAVKKCAKGNVKFLSIITSGFSEVGNSDEEEEIVTFANENGMRILGPNIFGLFSANASIDATFGPGNINHGNVAIITQSGALGIAMIGKTQVENIGLSTIVSLGNKSDIDESDLVEYLISDDLTKVIFMYMEGVKNGEKLIEVLTRATKVKPVVIIKSGRSKRGAIAAASHTGSLAGADEVFSDVMRQCGAHRATSINEALNWCKFLANSPRPAGENCVIITNGGGVGVIAADACEKNDVHLYDDTPSLETIFLDAVPSFGSVKNPIDITGGASMEDYERCIVNAFKNQDIHSIICLGCETAVLTGDTFKTTIEKIHNKYGHMKPAVYSFVGGKSIEDGISYLKTCGVPIYSDIYEAVSSLGQAYEDYRNLSTNLLNDEILEHKVEINEIKNVIKQAKKDNREFLLASEGQAVMKAAQVKMPVSKIATSIEEAIQYADDISYPVVMKIVSKDIIHKSDAGGIALDLQNKNEVINAYEAILFSCKQYNPRALIKGIEVMEMMPPGIETIIGGRYDNSFGPVIMFGLGGIYVEVMKDIAFRAITLNRHEIMGMLKEIRSYPLLLGVRGEEKKDIEGIVDVIQKVGIILKECPEISDIEINPLVIYDQEDGVKAVDVRILLR
ncbi:MAG: CoA-binding protein [Gammaproteobacteria bacterium]|nr:CoA-binding protein [Gammaproteobacteria bacterium]